MSFLHYANTFCHLNLHFFFFDKVLFYVSGLVKYDPMRASSYLPLPKEFKTKRGCVNIKNNDEKCFLWSILASLHPVQCRNHQDRVSKTRQPVRTHQLTDRNYDNLQGLSCQSGWTPFGRGCNLSQRCLLLLMSYGRHLWVVTVVPGIVQKNPYIHMGKLLFVSSMPNLLQFVVVDLAWVLVVGNGDFNSLHGRAWLHPLLHPLLCYWFVFDLVVEHKMTLNIFWSPWIALCLSCRTICQGRTE